MVNLRNPTKVISKKQIDAIVENSDENPIAKNVACAEFEERQKKDTKHGV